MMKRLHILYLFIAFAIVAALMGCETKSTGGKVLDSVEEMIVEYPDSALTILENVDCSGFSKYEKARYALLMSMALDKNYIDTTDFKVLQPAIDYFIDNGSADEKLRTLYYEGCIYQNKGDVENAMKAFLKARDLKDEVTDTLTLAHALVAQANIYYREYKLKEYSDNNIEAAKLYEKINRKDFELSCYVNVLGTHIMMSDKSASDSLFNICREFRNIEGVDSNYLLTSTISYKLAFGSEDDIRLYLDSIDDYVMSKDDSINVAYAYSKVGDFEISLRRLSEVYISDNIFDSLKYLAVKVDILRNHGEYKQALDLYEDYSAMLSMHHDKLFSNDLLFADQKHKLELDNLARTQSRDRVIWLISCVLLVLLVIIIILNSRFRIAKSRKIVAEKENDNLRLEQENLKIEMEKAILERNNETLEKEKLELEKKRLEAVHIQKELEAENLRHEKLQIERERDNLKELIKGESNIDKSVLTVINERLDILNGLLAKEITSNDSYAEPYHAWIESIREKRDEFMNSTRLVFTASHPRFMDYLKSHVLTESEINYLCLYAIGLRGKEVGEYIQLKRHYNISSEIRRKLGMGEHDTNIGIFIRRKMKELEAN